MPERETREAKSNYTNELKELRQEIEDLRRSNADLDNFATIAAHELQEPLRKILSYASMLEDSTSTEAERRKFLENVALHTRRMRQLVEDILSLSRVTTNARAVEKVDLNKIIEDIASELQPRLTEIGAKLTYAELPLVVAEPRQMKQLFLNLISNSLKFRRPTVPMLVALSCASAPKGFARVDVSDNGIGFDAASTERIFRPFQRLNRKADYEGSGMGLSICRRIMLRHGGEISATVNPAGGAVFTIIMPSA